MDGWQAFLAVFIGLIIVVLIWWFGGFNDPPSSSSADVPGSSPLSAGNPSPSNLTPSNIFGHGPLSPGLVGNNTTAMNLGSHSYSNLQPYQDNLPPGLISAIANAASVPVATLKPWSDAYNVTISTFNTIRPHLVSSKITIEELPDDSDDIPPIPLNNNDDDGTSGAVPSSSEINHEDKKMPVPSAPVTIPSPTLNDQKILSLPVTTPLSAAAPVFEPASTFDQNVDEKVLPTVQQQGKVYTPTVPRERSRHEVRCNEILEEYYGRPFAPIWHPQIVNPKTGYLLELDCYNEDLKLAVEYNGIQHYHWPNYTGMSEVDFQLLVVRDAYKKRRCAELGIYLIVVPHWVEFNDLRKYIHERLPENRAKSG